MAQESLADAEQKAFEVLRKTLPEQISLADRAFDLIGEMRNAIPTTPEDQVSLPFKVSDNLMVRLVDDYRSILLLLLNGYPSQAATLAASTYEHAYTIAYIGSDDERASKWAEHDDPTRTPKTISKVTRDALSNLGVPDPDSLAKTHYGVYRQLCLIRHGNPLFQKSHGFVLSDDSIVSINGPNTSEAGIRMACFVLEWAVQFALVGVHAFLLNHLPPDDSDNLAESFVDIGARLKKLREAGSKKWGTNNPFPGKW